MAYTLTEAYEDLYNPRVESNLDDNLRFIDHLQPEDIEEVVESMVWEFRDYGYDLDESFDLLKTIVDTEILDEAHEYLIEATVTQGRGSLLAAQARAAERKAARQTAQATARRNQRKAQIGSAISKVKAAWSGAKGGMGRAAKAVGGYISKQRDAGKARLQQLIRTGSGMASAALAAGKQKAQQARTAGTRATGRALGVVGGGVQAVGDRLSSAGQSARDTGRSMRRYGNKKSNPVMPDPWSQPSSGKQPNVRPVRVSVVQQPQLPSGRARLALPAKTSGTPIAMDPRREAAMGKIAKAAKGTTAKGRRFGAPGGALSPQRSNTDFRGRAARFARQAGVQEQFEYILDEILESLILEEYADNYDEALELFLDLSDETVYDLSEAVLYG
jgi:hypothetical protein